MASGKVAGAKSCPRYARTTSSYSAVRTCQLIADLAISMSASSVASSKEVDRVVGVEEIALPTRIIVLSECQSCSAPKKKGRR
jgi:hypothetical protein